MRGVRHAEAGKKRETAGFGRHRDAALAGGTNQDAGSDAWRTSDGDTRVIPLSPDGSDPCFRASYEPGLSIFVQGRKRILLGGTEYLCDGSSFLLSSIDVPAQSQIIEASEKTPLLSIFLRLDLPTVREVLSRDDIPEGPPSTHRQGLAVGETTVGLLGAAMRMLELLDTPEDIPFLSTLAHREILYRILRTPQAERLRAIATSGDLGQRTARAISWLRENYAKPLRMEELASTARMGVSTLHHQFRALRR